jgi:hypothetical protein
MPARLRRGGFFFKVPMPDYDLLIMSRDNTQKLPLAQEPGRWKAGDIVDIFPAGKLDHKTQHDCFAIVTVTDFPGTRDDLKLKLTPEDYAISDAQISALTQRREYTVPVPSTGVGSVSWASLSSGLGISA